MKDLNTQVQEALQSNDPDFVKDVWLALREDEFDNGNDWTDDQNNLEEHLQDLGVDTDDFLDEGR